jgi:hydrogenase maturation protein HypF
MIIMAKHLLITGEVHGVGFRPFVYTLATRLDLRGWVSNTTNGVEIYIEGSPANMEAFIQGLRAEKPRQARIDSMEVSTRECGHEYQTFDIFPSPVLDDLYQPVSADIAICPDCERELFDPGNRRYLYPFISCSNCGPRISILKDVPYSRQNTTMSEFGMCEHCSSEYQDPSDRRFHAHPIACPECGPFVALREIHSQWPNASLKISSIECRTSAILKARRLLREGYILAIKGPGGFQLACDASNSLTVEELRDRKGRVDKPFALMASDIEVVRSICRLSPDEERLLTSREKPIVLLEKMAQNRPGYNVSRWVAPCLDTLGVMLPSTPLHHLLLNQTDLLLGTEPVPPLLVMTSGGLADEPIAIDDEDALLRLSPLADAFILHNCDIQTRCDDSVVRVDHGVSASDGQTHSSSTVYLRRSRGYAPYAVKLPFEVKPTLAIGSVFQNSFCLARDQVAFLSQHIGDMENIQTYESFEQSVGHLSRVYGVQPQVIAHDLHPEYFSTLYVRQSALAARHVEVQHHHAHIASCMADNGLDDRRLIGLVFDGMGYGTDGALWGGEVLLASYSDFERFAHLEYLPLPGDVAGAAPWRLAAAYAHALGLEINGLPFLQHVDKQVLNTLRQQVDTGNHFLLTSCMGNLFDAVAGLTGIRNDATYASQAAMEMTALAKPFVSSMKCYPFVLEATETGCILRLKDLIAAIIQDLGNRCPIELIAARFHKTIAEMFVDVCRRARRSTGLNDVALSGSGWQNPIVIDLVRNDLKRDGFSVYTHRHVPANDSGLALGQTLVANHLSETLKLASPPGFAPVSKNDRPSSEKAAQ